MTRLVISASARRDIANVLDASVQGWGAAQGRNYRLLIEQALNDLLQQPEHPASRARDEIQPGLRSFHIARQGRPARHLILYRLADTGDLQVLRLVHDAMDLPQVRCDLP
jgi:toxin ParE1/3/4